MEMVTLGADTHKATHTLVAVDGAARELGHRTFAATTSGHLEALAWALQWSDRRWAMEDCRHVSRRLEHDLLGAGETVVRVPPKLMAGARSSARTRGKSDPIDALAVARAAVREPDLPPATMDGASRELRLLVDHREDLVNERTRIQNRLRWHLHELNPGGPAVGNLSRKKGVDLLDEELAHHHGLVADLARDHAASIRSLNSRIGALEHEIMARTRKVAPSLLALPGCGFLTAAKLVGEVGGAARFKSRAAFAMHNGTAPIPVWSGRADRFRLNRGGNRKLNTALHTIALTQLRLEGPGKHYIAKRVSLGNTKREAIRALRRRISDEVYRRMRLDESVGLEATAQAA
jgi:transposase